MQKGDITDGKLDQIILTLALVQKDTTGIKGEIADIPKNITSLNDTVNTLTVLKHDVVTLTSTVTECRAELAEANITELEKMMKQQMDKLAKQPANIPHATAQRQQNILIEAVKETPSEDVRFIAKDILTCTGTQIHPWNLDVSRLGKKYEGNRPRPILVSFVRMSLRNSILRSRLHIRNHQKCQGVWIHEDLDDCTRQHRADIRALVILANETGHSARQSTDDKFVDGRKYSKGTLHQPPHDLTMERAMLTTINKGLAFCSQHTCFSNFHQAPVKHNGIVYTSAEQAFQVTKARRGALHELADQMATQINPLTIKRLGKKATPPPNWQNERDMSE